MQAFGGTAGEHAEERDGEWSVSVPALWGDPGLFGEHSSLLPRLQKGEHSSARNFVSYWEKLHKHHTHFVLIGFQKNLSRPGHMLGVCFFLNVHIKSWVLQIRQIYIISLICGGDTAVCTILRNVAWFWMSQTLKPAPPPYQKSSSTILIPA